MQSEWTNFNSNFGALYTFFENLVETADKLDREKEKKLSTELANIFGENSDEVEKEILQYSPSIDDLEVLPDFRNDASVRELMKEIRDEQFILKIRDWEYRHPHKSHKLAKLIFSLFGNPPISGFILRKSILITSVTFLEVLIESMYINHYLLDGCEKEDAIQKGSDLAERSWHKRLENLPRIGIPSEILSTYREELSDVIDLRNLLVHNDGVVDQAFLKRSSGGFRAKLKPGDVLVVSTKRLQQSLDLLYSFGLLLCQSHWKLHEKDDKARNAKLAQLLITSFDEKRYRFIIELTERFMCLEPTEDFKQRLLVDRAIAYRELQCSAEVAKIVDDLERSEHDWQIEIAICTLRNNRDLLQRQIQQAASKYDVRKMVHWPLFGPMRDEIWFRKAFIIRRKKTNFVPARKKRK